MHTAPVPVPNDDPPKTREEVRRGFAELANVAEQLALAARVLHCETFAPDWPAAPQRVKPLRSHLHRLTLELVLRVTRCEPDATAAQSLSDKISQCLDARCSL